MIFKYLISLLFFGALQANPIIQKPFFYKASNPEFSPHHIYGFGTVHDARVNLHHFRDELWGLLSSFPMIMIEIADTSEFVSDKNHFLRKLKIYLASKIFKNPKHLDWNIIDFMRSKGLKIESLDNPKDLIKINKELFSLTYKSSSKESKQRATEIMKRTDMSLPEKFKNIRDLNKVIQKENQDYMVALIALYAEGDSYNLYRALITNNIKLTLTDAGAQIDFNDPSSNWTEFFSYQQETLFKARNKAWLEKILSTLKESDHSLPIFAGAGHFLEEDSNSLFHLLSAEGFEVTRLSQEEIVQELQNIQNIQNK